MMKPEPKLSHMPEQIKQKITDSVRNIGTKLAISQMSKGFLSLAKDSPTILERVTLKIFVDKLSVIVRAVFFKLAPGCFLDYGNSVGKNLVIEFSAHEEGVLMRNKANNWQKVLPEKDYRKAAIQYLLGIMGSKTTIKEFILEVDVPLFADYQLPRDPENRIFPAVYPKRKFEEDRKVIVDEMERFLRRMKHQLLVNKFSLKIELKDSQFLQILPYFEPGTLENFNVYYYFPSKPKYDREQYHLGQISKTEQWKKAKSLRFICHECDFRSEKFAHFEDLEICWRRPTLTMKAALECYINRPTLKKLRVNSNELFDTQGAKDYLTLFEPTKLECWRREGDMEVEMVLPDEPDTKIFMRLVPSALILSRLPYTRR